MPVRLLSSSILKWPEPQVVIKALHDWVERALPQHKEILRIGYFGSYARGNWGVGSDLDLVAIVESSAQPFDRRCVEFDTTYLPVPVDLFIYTKEEWQKLSRQGKWRQTAGEIVWIYEAEHISQSSVVIYIPCL